MYLPAHFTLHDAQRIRDLIEAHPLGILLRAQGQGFDADSIPFLVPASVGAVDRLQAHVARSNPLWQQCQDDERVLVVFRAADAYVSPNWYPSKAETHRHVPTWNYQVVNVHGRITIRDDKDFVRGVVARLTRVHEHRTHPERAWRMGDAPTDYIDAMVRNIVGIEILVDRIEAKAKLGQNREARDRLGAAQGLRDGGHAELAAAMRAAGETGSA